MEKAIVAIDSQWLNTAQDCARKHKFMFGLDHLEPINKPAAFERGDMLHRMLQAYYTLRVYRSRWQMNNRTHADVVDACVKIGLNAAFKMDIPPEDVIDVERTFREYCTHTADDGWDNIVAVENIGSKILYDSDELCILYEFKVDLIIKLINVPILPVDHKSSSQRREPEQLSNQFMGYCWALGVNNIIVNKVGFQKTLKPADKFQRHTLSYTNDVLDEWKENAIYWTKYTLANMQKELYPPNFTSCDKYSGCIFREVCKSDRITRQYKLRSMFRTREEWDPGRSLK